MAHHEHSNEHLSPEEKLYQKYIQGGDGFFNIELFESAKNNYNLALQIKPNDSYAKKQVDACCANIASDTRKILVVVPVLAIIITLLLFYFR